VKNPKEDNSIAQQVAKCKGFAKGKGWIVRENCIFTDSGKSGLVVNSGLEDLIRIAAVNPKPFDVLLCTPTDRIARDASLANRILVTLKRYGVEIYRYL
jgi:DNA invertase Pin-like site-specific DNA recombinase